MRIQVGYGSIEPRKLLPVRGTSGWKYVDQEPHKKQSRQFLICTRYLQNIYAIILENTKSCGENVVLAMRLYRLPSSTVPQVQNTEQLPA